MTDNVTVRVYRYEGADGEKPRLDTFEVSVHQHMSVLDLLFKIVDHHDPDVGFRFSCRVGMCGSCGILVNGREALACQTAVAGAGSSIELRPLNHLPVTKDLLVDLGPLFTRFEAVAGRFAGSSAAGVATLTADDDSALGEVGNCISCGLCLSACSVLDFDQDFVGPAAIYRALNLLDDSREEIAPDRIDLLTDEHGVWRCHVQQDCLEVCPKDLPLTQAIQTVKRRAVGSTLQNLFGGSSEPKDDR